jgi:hypothetical protein
MSELRILRAELGKLRNDGSATAGSYVPGGEPPAGVGYVGWVIVVTTSGQPSLVKVCVPNSSGGFEWVPVGQSS